MFDGCQIATQPKMTKLSCRIWERGPSFKVLPMIQASTRQNERTMSEITLDCAGKVRCGRLRKLVPWQMNDDFDGRSLGQFQRPVDDVLFGLLVEVAFTERRRVQCMEQ